MKNRNSTIKALLAGALIGSCAGMGGYAQTGSANLSPELQQVVRLAQQHINDDVIINYVKNSGKTFKLSADDIIYLNGQGVSQSVIGVLQTAAPADPALPPPVDSQVPAPPPLDTSSAAPVAAPPSGYEQSAVPPTPTMDYFMAQLTPYGSWVDVPGYGMCWQPAVDLGWRPYYDQGRWEYTDAGWYWQSDYPWGDIAFHYGRWAYAATGWIWVPGYEYAPAWVVWRHADADGFVGWAALPPGAVFVNGGWEFHHVRVGVDFDFALGLNFFTFVGYDHFWDHDFRHFIVSGDRLAFIYRRSVIENRYHLDHGRFINDGLGRDRMAALTHHEIRAEAVHDLRVREEQRNVLARRDDIHNYRPGAKPDGRRIAAPGFENHGQPGYFQKYGAGKAEENSKSYSRGSSQGGGKGEYSESK